MIQLKTGRLWQCRPWCAVGILVAVCALTYEVGCNGGRPPANPAAKANAQPSEQEDYRATDLPFKAGFSLDKGGGYSETWDRRALRSQGVPECGSTA